MMSDKRKIDNLKEYIKDMKKVCIAFSGGVDSTFLLRISEDILHKDVFAIIVNSIFFPEDELEFSKRFVKENNINYEILDLDITKFDIVTSNTVDRCYYCKLNIFKLIKKTAKKHGYDNVLDGSNFDDVKDYRPGAKALKELSIISPLKELEFTKQEIRDYSKELGIITWDKPPYACLASRIPYNSEITFQKIKMVEKSEQVLKELGFKQFRVRHHGDNARIELLPEDRLKAFKPEVEKLIVTKFKEVGFKYIAIDIEGYKMGNLNKFKEVDADGNK